MQNYHREVYLKDVDRIAKDIKTLTDEQLAKLRGKFAEIKELVDLYTAKNKSQKQI